MQLIKLALTLATATLLYNNTSQIIQARVKHSPTKDIQRPILSPRLQAAVEDLRVMSIKVDSGINLKQYGENITDLKNTVDNADGDAKTLAAVKSAVKGHKLALEFWQCDHTSGYDELHECQDKALKGIFTKYPDIKAEAIAAVEGENLSYISAGLDKDQVLQAVWRKTSADTQKIVEAIAPSSSQDNLASTNTKLSLEDRIEQP